MADQHNMHFDLGNLLGYDRSPTEEPLSLLEQARRGTEYLVRSIFSLPSRLTEDGKIAQLPPPVTSLPREKPLPLSREPTKWEKFAKEKGIRNKKRDRMLWDEERKEFRPRWGYKSIKSNDDQWVIEEKGSGGGANAPIDVNDGSNPFLKAKKDAQKNVKLNKKQRHANLKRTGLVDQKASAALSVVEPRTSKSAKLNVPKEKLRSSLKVAQLSTASVGRFDTPLRNEPMLKHKGKRQKFDAVTPSSKKQNNGSKSEKDKSLNVLNSVLKGALVVPPTQSQGKSLVLGTQKSKASKRKGRT